MKKTYLIALLVIAVGIGAYRLSVPPTDLPADSVGESESSALVDIQIPGTFSANAQIGKRIFEAHCATCHGIDAVGQVGVAPPLVHIIYEPGHHGDESFQRAVAAGVRGHHWPFGDMPPIEGLTRGDVAMIITYIRELQEANGIN